MNEKLQEIINYKSFTDVSGKWISKENCLQMSRLVIEECIKSVENTSKTHAYTSYDVSLIEETIERSVKSIKKHFGLENQ